MGLVLCTGFCPFQAPALGPKKVFPREAWKNGFPQVELENETGDWKCTAQLSPPEANPVPTIMGGVKKLTAMACITLSTYTESRAGGRQKSLNFVQTFRSLPSKKTPFIERKKKKNASL